MKTPCVRGDPSGTRTRVTDVPGVQRLLVLAELLRRQPVHLVERFAAQQFRRGVADVHGFAPGHGLGLSGFVARQVCADAHGSGALSGAPAAFARCSPRGCCLVPCLAMALVPPFPKNVRDKYFAQLFEKVFYSAETRLGEL